VVNTFIPGDDILYDIVAIVTNSRAAGGVLIETVEGTGLLVAPDTLVTCYAWTFGYSLPEVHVQGEGSKFITLHPRLLKGHVTRALMYPHPFYGDTPSYELSFTIPVGLSGAPLFRGGTHEAVGVVYGNNDTSTVEEEDGSSRLVDPTPPDLGQFSDSRRLMELPRWMR
jgi:hypothetical protein